MGLTAVSGPTVSYGITQTSSGLVTEYNEERGPNLSDLGMGVLDPRAYFNYKPGSPVGTRLYGLFQDAPVVDCQPFTANTSAISGSSATIPVAGTALTLTPVASFGAIQTTIIAPETGLSVSVIALDSTASVLTYGDGDTIAIWNPAAVPGRTISLTKASTDATALTYTVNGRDQYGIKMTETITASTLSSVGVGKKAFKYISSIVPATTTINSTGIGIGFTDTFGFPLAAYYFGMTGVVCSSLPGTPTLMVLSTANAVVASTATATSTTGDVRGTFSSTVATNGSTLTGVGASSVTYSSAVRIQVRQFYTPYMSYNTSASDQSATFGVTQYSNF